MVPKKIKGRTCLHQSKLRRFSGAKSCPVSGRTWLQTQASFSESLWLWVLLNGIDATAPITSLGPKMQRERRWQIPREARNLVGDCEAPSHPPPDRHPRSRLGPTERQLWPLNLREQFQEPGAVHMLIKHSSNMPLHKPGDPLLSYGSGLQCPGAETVESDRG